MERSSEDKNQFRFFQLISSTEINIDKGDIFYRVKYNDIINYLKMILTDFEDLVNIDYKQYVKPKGCLLININPGSDIITYLMQISKNYQLDLIALNYNEIIKDSEDFLNDFLKDIKEYIKNEAGKDKKKEISKDSSIENEKPIALKENYRIFIINENDFPPNFFKEKLLFSRLINYFKNSDFFIKNKTILIWINNNFQEIIENGNKIYDIFDLLIKIPVLDKSERAELLKNFSENNPKIVFDINTLVEKSQAWEVGDLYQLLKIGIFKHFLNSELNDSSNEITDILVDLIDEEEFIPSYLMMGQSDKRKFTNLNASLDTIKNIKSKKDILSEEELITNEYINHFKNESISEFMLEQLYEHAASKHYNELVIVIDKLSKNEALEDNDRKLLGKYPFLLNDKPKMAQIRFEKAKKRIDQIRKVFGD